MHCAPLGAWGDVPGGLLGQVTMRAGMAGGPTLLPTRPVLGESSKCQLGLPTRGQPWSPGPGTQEKSCGEWPARDLCGPPHSRPSGDGTA